MCAREQCNKLRDIHISHYAFQGSVLHERRYVLSDNIVILVPERVIGTVLSIFSWLEDSGGK